MVSLMAPIDIYWCLSLAIAKCITSHYTCIANNKLINKYFKKVVYLHAECLIELSRAIIWVDFSGTKDVTPSFSYGNYYTTIWLSIDNALGWNSELFQ